MAIVTSAKLFSDCSVAEATDLTSISPLSETHFCPFHTVGNQKIPGACFVMLKLSTI